jgi:ADP-ribosylglycohydrolase
MIGAVAGGIAEAFYGPVPASIRAKVEEILAPELWRVTVAFYRRFMPV